MGFISTISTLLKEVFWWARRVPVTILILLVTVAAGFYTGALFVSAFDSGLDEKLGWGLPAFYDGNYLSVITGLLIAPVPWMYLLIPVLLAMGAGFIEYKYGALKMLVTLIVTHVVSVLALLFLLIILAPTGWEWVEDFSAVYDVGMSNAAFGAIGVMTAGLSLVWRRRTRLLLILYCLAALSVAGEYWDLTHFFALLTGISIGPWVVGHPVEKISVRWSKQEIRTAVALVVLFDAITTILSKVYPGNGGLVHYQISHPEHTVSTIVTIAAATFLLLLAYGLNAGKVVAWRLAISLVTLSLVVPVLTLFVAPHASIILDTIFTSLLLILLIVFRKIFSVESDKIVRKNVLRRLLFFGAALFLFNAVTIYALRTSFSPEPSFGQALVESLYQSIGVSSGMFQPVTTGAETFIRCISAFWLVAVLVAMAVLIFSTVRERDEGSAFADYIALLHSEGGATISWMTTWEGIHYWVNAEKTAGFGYRLENSFAIVLGNPVGSRQAVAASFRNFELMCRRRGWHPTYFAVDDGFRRAIGKRTLKSIQVGEDTIIELANLTLSGKPWQSVRSAINRAAKDNIQMRVVRLSEAPIGLRDQLKAIANSWVEDKSLPEMGFTLGTLKEAEDPEVRMHVAIDTDGTVHGMTSWMPVYKKGVVVGWTIDIMQRRLDKGTMNGVMEFLIAESALTFKQEGYEFISLSTAPLSHEGESSNSVEKLLDIVADRMEPYYGFKSLYNFKKKFQPRYEPLYLCYHDEAELLAIALAIGKAYMPSHIISSMLIAKLKK